MKTRCSRPHSAYTLVEVLVAMSIIALAIGAAAQLSLSQALTEEITHKEIFAVNYAENAARLWQLGLEEPAIPGPASISSILLNSRNPNGSIMTLRIDGDLDPLIINAPVPLNAGDDGPPPPTAPAYAITVESTNVSVNWLPPGKSSTSALTFPILRQTPPRR